MKLAGSVAVVLEDGREVAAQWARNRLHFQPRVFTLSFTGPDDAFAEGDGLAARLIAKVSDALAEHDPLLLRATLDEGSPLLPALQDLGFLLTRGVYVVEFNIAALLDQLGRLQLDPNQTVRVVPLAKALETASEEAIMSLWLGVYGRAARLDPATPQVLSPDELRESFLGDEELDANVSMCALHGGRPVGICPVYRSSTSLEMELGAVGVESGLLDRHSEISLTMVQHAARRAASVGAERMQVEVDSDAPWGLYAFAGLSGRVSESLVSLMYVPKWVTPHRWPAHGGTNER